MNPKDISNTLRLTCTRKALFRHWLEYLSPLHHLTGRELDIATAFLVEHDRLSKVILDDELLNRTLMSEDTQKKIREDCNVTKQHFGVIKTHLKDKKFFDGNKIQARLIPNIDKMVKDKYFILMLVFEIKDDVQGDNTESSQGA